MKSDKKKGRLRPEDFLPGQTGQRTTKLARVLRDTLRVADPEVRRAFAGEVLAALIELRVLDKARVQWVLTEDSIAEMTKELERGHELGIDVDTLRRGLTVAEALQAEARQAFVGLGPAHQRFEAGYQAGCAAFDQRIERRVSAICGTGENLRYPVTRHAAVPFRKRKEDRPSAALTHLRELCRELPANRAAWRESLAERAAGVLAGLRSDTHVRDNMPVARLLVKQLTELNLLESVEHHLSAAEATRRDLRRRRGRLLARKDLSREESEWHNALARELRDQARFTASGSGRVGDDFVSGFNLACNRISTALYARAEAIVIPDHLLGR